MNAYSCKPSDRPSDAGMHTLMCIAVLASGICSDESCTVSDMSMRPSRGNCLVSDSVSSLRAAVLNPQVAIPFLRAQGAQVLGSGHFAISSIDNSIQFSLFPAHINISYSNNNVYILCRKRGGQKTMLMDVRPLTITSKLRVK